MSEFEQMMADIDLPEEIAKQMSAAATNGEILEVWQRLTPAIEECMGDCSTAAGVCAIGMLLASVGDQVGTGPLGLLYCGCGLRASQHYIISRSSPPRWGWLVEGWQRPGYRTPPKTGQVGWSGPDGVGSRASP